MPFEPLNKAAEKEETQMIASKKSMMMGGNNDAIRALVAEAKEYEEKEEEEGMKPWANCEPPMTKDDKDQIFKEEKENHEERQKQYQCSWHKKVSEQGHAPGVYDGDRVTMHYVGHLRTLDGPVFDSTRERGVPVIINADRGSLAPGLDKGILTCNEGEKCVFTIQPEGGYGNAGYVDSKGVRTVPGDCVLVFEVEIIKVIEQYELWNLDYDTKMSHAAEYRERGNTLFRNKYYKMADEEYEHAMRYLLFHPHPTDEQQPFIREGLTAVQLNVMATKLRIGEEEEALLNGEKVLEIVPNHAKALYRMGQAHVALGNYKKAEAYLNKAMKAAGDDDEAVKSCELELDRLEKRQETHKAKQKKAYTRMVQPKASEVAKVDPPRLLRIVNAITWPYRILFSLAVAAIGVVIMAEREQ
mmetsp:Transcript_46225/g.128450  ORF Transcript_46225/g.128450 Transcript_46225/m.128450 type:complete len:414 (+) Transcript_46225:56-1297(+)